MRADGVFSGGGIKGLAFVGALQAAAEAGYDEWVRLAGTSSGAIIAMALAVGYDAPSLKAEIDNFDFSKIDDYGAFGSLQIPFNLELRHGVTQGKVLSAWIEQLLSRAPHSAKTFGELPPDKLQVVGVDLAHTRMVPRGCRPLHRRARQAPESRGLPDRRGGAHQRRFSLLLPTADPS